MKSNLSPLVEIMARLRAPETGCPWDLVQDFNSIAPYTIEEAYEVADAIARDDMDDLCDELGDLLLQVVFHSQMAKEAGYFTIDNVITKICDKMVRRHPHIFEAATLPETAKLPQTKAETVINNWESIKAEERALKSDDISALSGVARALPALLRAQKIQKRAARTGFDWPDIGGAIDKLNEEITELAEAENDMHAHEEMGDLLFAAVNIARHLKIDAESALKDATEKFERRFRHMENDAGSGFSDLPLDAKEEFWKRAKNAEKN